jgi:hypothetical protein
MHDCQYDDTNDPGPASAVAYLYEAGDTTTLIDLLTAMLLTAGWSEEEVAAELEKRAVTWLADQQEQWWEAI